MKKSNLSQSDVTRILDYDPESGVLLWKTRPLSSFPSEKDGHTWNSRYAGKQAGHIGSNGYRIIGIGPQKWLAHRLAWLIIHGVLPNEIDHIDGNRDNNRITNFRDTTRAQNLKNQKRKINNKSGVTGVCWNKTRKRWTAQIRVDYIFKALGAFDTIEAAITARHAAEKLYGFHPNHGRA